jgi:hypothetical protein
VVHSACRIDLSRLDSRVLHRQGAKMGDTIALNTRILLALKDFHDEAMVHGESVTSQKFTFKNHSH